MQAALRDAGLTANEVDRVILVGGSTRIPAVQEAVRKMVGKSRTATSTRRVRGHRRCDSGRRSRR